MGTDGPASNNTLDMLESLRLAVLVQKLVENDPEALPSLRGAAAGHGGRRAGPGLSVERRPGGRDVRPISSWWICRASAPVPLGTTWPPTWSTRPRPPT